jgi:hypothetical protein
MKTEVAEMKIALKCGKVALSAQKGIASAWRFLDDHDHAPDELAKEGILLWQFGCVSGCMRLRHVVTVT